jgi:hypothetical protein
MRIIIGVTTILLLAVFSVAYIYFSSLTVDSRSNDKALAGIPSDASVIFHFANDKSLYDIFKDYPVFRDISGTKRELELSWLKDLLLKDPDLYNSTQGLKVFLSFHADQSGQFEFLWSMPLKDNLQINELSELIARQGINQTRIIESPRPHIEVTNRGLVKPFYVSVEGGVVQGSFRQSLLLKSLDGKSEKINRDFIREINKSLRVDNDALSSVFINHNEPGFLKPLFKQKPTGNFGLFSAFSAYSSLNLNYKSDALMFNGTTRITDKHDGYLNLFLEQKPVKNTIKRIIPPNLSNAICYGLSDYSLFNAGLTRLFKLRQEDQTLTTQMQMISSETGINPDRDIKKLWGQEFSTIQLSTYENLAVIRISNGRQLQFYLEPLSSSYSESVRKMNYEGLFYYYFGDPIKRYAKPFFTIVDNMIIISNSPGTVQRFLNDYNGNKLLFRNEVFLQFDQLIADQSNISFLLQFNNSQTLLGSILNKGYTQTLTSKDYGFRNFYGLSFQLTSNRDHFFTNFYLGYRKALTALPDSLVYKTGTTD